MNNTTTTPRDRIINEIVKAVDAPAARRAIGELEIREPDASVRVRLSKLAADVSRKLGYMSHVEFIDARGALALSNPREAAREALEAFGLGAELPTPPPWEERPRRVWDPSAGMGRPRTSDRHSKADEALSDLVAEKVVRTLAEREAVNASEELSKWKVRAEANAARAGRLRAIVGAWIGSSGMTRDSVRVWDRELGEALDVAKNAASWGTTEAEIQADYAAKIEEPSDDTVAGRWRMAGAAARLRAILVMWGTPERMDTRATLRACDPAFARMIDDATAEEGLECQTPGAAATRREEAAEAPKDGEVGPATREAIQRAQGVTFKGEDLEALQAFVAIYCHPGSDSDRIRLGVAWPALDKAIDGLLEAYNRVSK